MIGSVLEPNVVEGLKLFVRYAYPPNLRGYCGPADHATLLEYGMSEEIDEGLLEMASEFTGPWPYLNLIAAHAGIHDPFDRRVVEAYWVGNALLEGIDTFEFGNTIDDTFRKRAGARWMQLSEAIPEGIVPHHAFHVFGVYPWVGMLSHQDHGQPLEVLQNCRIRWGQVVEVTGDTAVVRSRPLTWDGRRLDLGPRRSETVQVGAAGSPFVADLRPGEWVSLHWDWVCDRLDRRRVKDLQRVTTRQLAITNARTSHPGTELIG
jgi:hypothetical protein